MKALIGITAAAGLILAAMSQPASAQVVGKTITFVNGDSKCVNVGKNLVSVWITSARIEKRDSLFSSTESAGAEADLTLTSPTNNQSAKFVMAKDINVRDMDGKIVRAGLSFNILAGYQFEEAAKVAKIDIPVMFLRTKGDSAVASYAKALIKFSSTASGLIPGNPYSGGVKLTGDLATAFFETASAAAPKDVAKPNMYISASLSRTSTCNANDLHDGVQAKISDVTVSGAQDVIKADDSDNYCFYLVGAEADRDIGYTSRPAGAECPTTVPTTRRILNNPQVIFAVWQAPLPDAKKVQKGLGRNKQLWNAAEGTVVTSLFSLSPKLESEEISRAVGICRQVGVDADQCLGTQLTIDRLMIQANQK